jgi:hypothetical protein
MKNKKLFLVVSLLITISVVTIIGGMILWHYKENVNAISIVVAVYFGILSILFFVFQMIFDKKKENESINNGRKRYKSGYFIIPIWIFSIIYILIALLYKWDNTMLYLGIGVCVISFIWTFILGILSKQSLSGREDFIVQPEKIWRIIWNMLPARWGYENNPILNVLIIYSKEGEEQAEQTREKYKQAENELRIDCHLCEVNKKGQLDNKLNTTKYIGVHLIYTEDIKTDMLWVRELLFEWANKNKSKPIVYTNYTTEEQPLNYGTSNKDSDGIMRLFQRTHTLSELWREQSNIQYIVLKCFSFSFIIILIGLVTLFLNRMKNDGQNNGEQKQIVLVGGGTVKDYIENKKLSNDNYDLIFIPTPSNIACGQLGDDGFMEAVQDAVIMSSKRQVHDSVFNLERLSDKHKIKNILEVFLDYDTMYVRSKGVEWKEECITLEALAKKLSNNPSIKIFHTNPGSATYDFYEKTIDTLKNKKDVYYLSQTFQEEKECVVLTRSSFDPLSGKDKTINPKIYIIDSEKHKNKEFGELFLYIPIRSAENKNLIIPQIIQNFIKDIQKDKENKDKFELDVKVDENNKIKPDPKYRNK